MSLLDLGKRASEALGLTEKAPSVNPLEVIGLSWRITLQGIDDDGLYAIVKAMARDRVMKIHPDAVKRVDSDGDLKIRDAFEALKDRKAFDSFLQEFKNQRSEEAHYTRQIKSQSSEVKKRSNRMELELKEEQEQREYAEDQVKFYSQRLFTFIRMQSILNRPKDDQLEILHGKSSQVNLCGINGVRQLVVCHIEADFVAAPSEEAIERIKTLGPRIRRITNRKHRMISLESRIERRYKEAIKKRWQIKFRDEKPSVIYKRIQERLRKINIELEQGKDYILANNLGYPTLEEAITEGLVNPGGTKSLPIIKFKQGNLFSRLKLPLSVYFKSRETQSTEEIRVENVRKLERSSESVNQLSQDYLQTLEFYKESSPSNLVLKSLLIIPKVLSVREGALIKGGGPKKNTKIIGCIPSATLSTSPRTFEKDGKLKIGPGAMVRNLVPCVARGGLIISIQADQKQAGWESLVKRDPEEFFSELSNLEKIHFTTEEIVLAIYT